MVTEVKVLAVIFLLVTASPVSARRMAAFAIGRGPAAMQAAVEVQKQARELVQNSGTWESVRLEQLVQPEGEPEKMKLLNDGRQLLQEGRAAYEQLDLEKAIAAFSSALNKFEAAYALLDEPGPLVECLVFLGAVQVLMGDASLAKEFFGRALDFPGEKKLDVNLFPPNIQEVFEQTRKEIAASVGGGAYFVSEPLGAGLWVDGIFRGGTPATLENLRAGMHLGRVEKDGYLPWGGRLKIVAGGKRNLRVSLRPAAKSSEFSNHFRRMSAELAKGAPGEGARGLAAFLRAERLLLVLLEGEVTAMKASAYLVDVPGASAQQTFDLTTQEYPQRLKEFLLEFLKLAGPEPKSVAEVAGEEGGELGLDLSEQGEQEAGGASALAQEETTTPSAAEETPISQEQVDKQTELEVAAALAAPLAEEKKGREGAAREDSSPWWRGITGRWWFWTAVGVLAAGAATGAYFLAAPSSSSGGGLVIQIH